MAYACGPLFFFFIIIVYFYASFKFILLVLRTEETVTLIHLVTLLP